MNINEVTHILCMQNKQSLLVHLIKWFQRSKESDDYSHNNAQENYASKQHTSTKSMGKWYCKREGQSTERCDNCCDNVVCRGFPTDTASLFHQNRNVSANTSAKWGVIYKRDKHFHYTEQQKCSSQGWQNRPKPVRP